MTHIKAPSLSTANFKKIVRTYLQGQVSHVSRGAKIFIIYLTLCWELRICKYGMDIKYLVYQTHNRLAKNGEKAILDFIQLHHLWWYM